MSARPLIQTMLLTAFTSFAIYTSPLHAADLVVVVENIKAGQGNIRAALFDQESFLGTPIQGLAEPARSGSMSFTFQDVVPGRYAISVFHDVSGNKKLDTNFVGMPSEPYGFSRSARGRFGPPTFDDASVDVDDGTKTVVVQLK